MKNSELAKKIKELRNRKGFSQEELSEQAGLSLRTIQRVENGETEPRSDSLKRIAAAFDVAPDEILDWAVYEDKGFLISLSLSALGFMIFPILGILIPLIIWISKKDKIKDINNIAKDILNFQIAWTILFFIGYIFLVAYTTMAFSAADKMESIDFAVEMFTSRLNVYIIFVMVMYLYNLVFIIVNSVRINKEKAVKYFPKLRFIR